jgi:large subunit ribosomal protein L4
MADVPTAKLLGADGKEQGRVDLDPDLFGIEPNMPVMHEVVTAQLAAARAGTHSTKTRAEVRGGGRKPWRQKGLGRARHGSIRSPQWVGGGVVHGPRPRDYTKRTNKKVKRLALLSSLSARAADEQVMVVERLEFETPKTKDAVEFLEAAGLDGGKVLIVVDDSNQRAWLSFRNIRDVNAIAVSQLNPYDVLWSDTVLFTSATLEAFSGGDSYEVADDDFVREEAGATEAEADAAPEVEAVTEEAVEEATETAATDEAPEAADEAAPDADADADADAEVTDDEEEAS